MKKTAMIVLAALLAACDMSTPDPHTAVPTEPELIRLEVVQTIPVVDEPNHWVELNESGTGLREYTPSRPHGEWWDDLTGGKIDSDGRIWVNSGEFTEDNVRIWNVYGPDRTHLFNVAVRTITDATGHMVLAGTRIGAEEGYVDFHILKFKK